MRRIYKLTIIILTSIILAYFIYFYNRENKINLVALGDGVASGETSYQIDGISYNDYLKEYFAGKKILKRYDDNYVYLNYTLKDFIVDLKDNITKNQSKYNIQQTIHKADIITIFFGEEELVKKAMTNDLNEEEIDEFIANYDNLLYMLKDITNAQIVTIGYYENQYLNETNVILLNSKLANLALKYQVSFINISDVILNSDYYLDPHSFYFNYKGHRQIADMIIHSI